ncbi:MAG: hypothetical protein CL772_01330 [Chloroflexi bacterium]|nr:hypothetical protein [Chloroflexota bacterium]
MQRTKKLKKEKILITGGLGFVGSNLTNFFSELNEVLILDIENSNPYQIKTSPNVEIENIDIRSEKISKIISLFKPTSIIHCAAQTSVIDSIKDPEKTKSINIEGTNNLVSEIKKLDGCYFTFISSGGAIYGEPKYLPVDEKHSANPISEYGKSKLEGEKIVSKLLYKSKIEYSILRPSNIYGPKQKSQNVIPIFINKMLKNNKIIIYGDGNSTRDYIYIDDLVNIINLFCTKKISSKINLSSNYEVKIIDIYKILKEKLNYKLNPIFKEKRKGEVENIVLDNSELISITNYSQFTNIVDGIEKTVNF